MKLSDFRKILAKIEEEHGDLAVTTYQWNDPAVPHRVEGVEVLTVRPHYFRKDIPETYVDNKRIRDGGYGGGGMFVAKYQKKILQRPLERVVHIYYDRD